MPTNVYNPNKQLPSIASKLQELQQLTCQTIKTHATIFQLMSPDCHKTSFSNESNAK